MKYTFIDKLRCEVMEKFHAEENRVIIAEIIFSEALTEKNVE